MYEFSFRGHEVLRELYPERLLSEMDRLRQDETLEGFMDLVNTRYVYDVWSTSVHVILDLDYDQLRAFMPYVREVYAHIDFTRRAELDLENQFYRETWTHHLPLGKDFVLQYLTLKDYTEQYYF